MPVQTEPWVLEWSQRSNNLHIQPLARTLGLNGCRFVLDHPPPNDYVILAVGAHDEIHKAAGNARKLIRDREQFRERTNV